MRVKHPRFRAVFPAVLLLFFCGGLPLQAQEYSPEVMEAIAFLEQTIRDNGYSFTVAPYPGIEQRLANPGGGLVMPENYRDLAPNEKPAARRDTPLPAAFSWHDYDALTPVKNQGACGSCWAFAMCGVAESAVKRALGLDLDISEQWLVSCNVLGYSCEEGGFFCYEFFTNAPGLDGEIGIVQENDFPYLASDLKCDYAYPYNHIFRLENYGNIGSSGPNDIELRVEDIKRAILQYGPVSVAIYAGGAMSAYAGGVFDLDSRDWPNHAVVLYGWDDSQGEVGVWLLRNSWGEVWGEKPSFSWGLDAANASRGYMRIEYGCSRVGYGAMFATFDSGPAVPRYSELQVPRELVGGGVAQNWKADEAVWRYDLPFPFPFYQELYPALWVSSNGYVAFNSGTCLWNFSIENLKNTKILAPVWADLSTEAEGRDVYLTASPDQVVIRWVADQAGVQGTLVNVDVELALRRNGSFQFNYGGGYFYQDFPVVGFSQGNGSDYYLTDVSGRWSLQSDFANTLKAGDFVDGVNRRRPIGSRIFTPLVPDAGVLNGDYDGDGRSDLAVFRPVNGLWALKGISRFYFGQGLALPVSGDYNGNGTADPAVFRSSDGFWAIRNLTRVYFGAAGDLPVPGDYDGDGKADIAVFRPASGLWLIRGLSRFYFGSGADTPVPGDYSGDGLTQAAVFRPLTGRWSVRGGGTHFFGQAGDVPLPGDYTGDGSDLIAVFRPASRRWLVRGLTKFYYGAAGDIPVPLDYSGVKALRAAVFRPSNGLWLVRGATRAYFGRGGDGPATR